MIVSSRKLIAMGLGILGVGLVVGTSVGQQDKGTAPARPAVVPPVVGTVDISAVFKEYQKVKVLGEEFKAAATAKQNELMKLMNEGQQEAEMLAKMTPGSQDYKKREDRISTLKAQVDAGREQAQRDFQLRESDMLATLYKEVQDMVAAIAKYQGMTYIMRVSNEPVSGNNPSSVMMAMDKTVVYSDPRNDITRAVIHNLNLNYEKMSRSASPKATAPAGPATPKAN